MEKEKETTQKELEEMTLKELEEQDEREMYEEVYNFDGEFTLPND